MSLDRIKALLPAHDLLPSSIGKVEIQARKSVGFVCISNQRMLKVRTPDCGIVARPRDGSRTIPRRRYWLAGEWGVGTFLPN